jgi:hypothetical protein
LAQNGGFWVSHNDGHATGQRRLGNLLIVPTPTWPTLPIHCPAQSFRQDFRRFRFIQVPRQGRSLGLVKHFEGYRFEIPKGAKASDNPCLKSMMILVGVSFPQQNEISRRQLGDQFGLRNKDTPGHIPNFPGQGVFPPGRGNSGFLGQCRACGQSQQ